MVAWTRRRQARLLVVAIAAVFVGYGVPGSAEPAPVAIGSSVRVFGGDPEHVDLVRWAATRFETRELAVPAVDVHFHPDTSGCYGHLGSQLGGRVDVCVVIVSEVARETLLHEMGHAWIDENVTQLGPRAVPRDARTAGLERVHRSLGRSRLTSTAPRFVGPSWLADIIGDDLEALDAGAWIRGSQRAALAVDALANTADPRTPVADVGQEGDRRDVRHAASRTLHRRRRKRFLELWGLQTGTHRRDPGSEAAAMSMQPRPWRWGSVPAPGSAETCPASLNCTSRPVRALDMKFDSSACSSERKPGQLSSGQAAYQLGEDRVRGSRRPPPRSASSCPSTASVLIREGMRSDPSKRNVSSARVA